MVRFPSRRTGSQSSAENAPHNRTQLSSISLHPPERALLTQSRWLRFQLSASKKCHWLASHGSTDRVALPSALVAPNSAGTGYRFTSPATISVTPQTTSKLMINSQAVMGPCQARHGPFARFPAGSLPTVRFLPGLEPKPMTAPDFSRWGNAGRTFFPRFTRTAGKPRGGASSPVYALLAPMP